MNTDVTLWSVDVEALAVGHITTLISQCAHLKPFISVNDKTPLTDGHIDLFAAPGYSNDSWTGRVPVQVKGRTRTGKRIRSFSFRLSRTELIAHQKDSGVLYFVVVVNKDTGEMAPFYRLLSPFGIKDILEGMPEGDSKVSIKFKPLPTGRVELERIVGLALKTREQNVNTGFDSALFERVESITLHLTEDVDFGEPVILKHGETEFALTIKTVEGLSVHLDGEFRIIPEMSQSSVRDISVVSDGLECRPVFYERVSKTELVVTLCEGLVLRSRALPEGGVSLGLDLLLQGSLPNQERALSFFFAIFDTGLLNIDGRDLSLKFAPSNNISDLRRRLAELKKLIELFEVLGVNLELIDPGSIDKAQIAQLNIIHRSMILGKEMTGYSRGLAWVIQKVGPWCLALLVVPEGPDGAWVCVDPFSSSGQRQFLWSKEGEGVERAIPVTAYDAVSEGDLGNILNLHPEGIVDAYEAIADSPDVYWRANDRVLHLIRAADSCDRRREVLLEAALCLTKWLLKEAPGEVGYRINEWQIEARLGSLDSLQRKAIRDVKRSAVVASNMDGRTTELACAILLDDPEEVDDALRRLDEESLDRFKSWPIWTLWHQHKERRGARCPEVH